MPPWTPIFFSRVHSGQEPFGKNRFNGFLRWVVVLEAYWVPRRGSMRKSRNRVPKRNKQGGSIEKMEARKRLNLWLLKGPQRGSSSANFDHFKDGGLKSSAKCDQRKGGKGPGGQIQHPIKRKKPKNPRGSLNASNWRAGVLYKK